MNEPRKLNDLNIFIVGLGMIGGSYAKGLTQKGILPFGYDVNQNTLKYAIENKLINANTNFDENIKIADLIILCLYPKDNIEWLKKYQTKLKVGTIITDVSGIKRQIIDEINEFLRKDLVFVSSHPMAGREQSGILVSDNKVFIDANYIIIPLKLELNIKEQEAVVLIQNLAEILGFKNIEILDCDTHDKLVSYLSQLTHVIAVTLMNCHNVEEMIRYTGDSFRDLTRIAKINEKLWSELFLLNKKQLVKDIDDFMSELNSFKELIVLENENAIKSKLILSTERRRLFDKNPKK